MKTFAETLVSDFLSEVTRRERRSLLGVSMLCIAFVHAGLIPTKISALGIEFDEGGQDALLWIFALVVCYYIGAFVVYGLADFALWRHQFHEANIIETEARRKEILAVAYPDPPDPEEEHILTKAESREISNRFESAYSGRYRWRRVMPYVSATRAFFDFGLPICVGSYALYALVFR